ncbi:MAG: Gfo/Idh/MocA family protein [Aggregatilineales bacterium]
MASKVKIAVVGTGWWATTAHIPALKENPRAELVLVDKNPTALKAASEKYNVKDAYTSVGEAVKAHPDLKGAIVAVPHAAHYEVGKAVLDHGLYLLMEKPMTLHAKEAKALVDLADAKGLQILIGYTFPYLHPLQEAKKRIDDGLLGNIEYITCSMTSLTIEFYRGKPENYDPVMKYVVTGPGADTYSDPKIAGGGQAQLQITHSAAMMFYLAPGLRAATVSAFMNTLDTKVDVVDAFAVRMNNGAVATVGSSGNIGPGDAGLVEVHLHGNKGRLLVDAISGLMVMRLHSGKQERIEPTFPAYPGHEPSRRFIEIIADGAKNYFPGKDNGLYTVELLEAAYRSAEKEGMPVKVSSLYA